MFGNSCGCFDGTCYDGFELWSIEVDPRSCASDTFKKVSFFTRTLQFVRFLSLCMLSAESAHKSCAVANFCSLVSHTSCSSAFLNHSMRLRQLNRFQLCCILEPSFRAESFALLFSVLFGVSRSRMCRQAKKSDRGPAKVNRASSNADPDFGMILVPLFYTIFDHFPTRLQGARGFYAMT